MARHSNPLVWRDRVLGRIDRMNREREKAEVKRQEKIKANADARLVEPQPIEPLTHAAATETDRLRRIADQLLIEATAATNALACVARAQYQHAEVARLHTAIAILKEELIGSATVPSAERRAGSAAP